MTIKTQTERPSVALSAEILRDLLDHDLDTLEVARRHDLDPDAVRAAVRSNAFRRAADAMREADQARTAAVWPSIQARAIHRLARIANQPAETPTQTESARRALTALLKCKPPGGTGVPPVRDTEPASEPRQHLGCHADGAAFCTPQRSHTLPAIPTLGDLITALTQSTPTPPAPTPHQPKPSRQNTRANRSPPKPKTPAQLLAHTGTTLTS